jgi:hypothetical protein
MVGGRREVYIEKLDFCSRLSECVGFSARLGIRRGLVL